MLESSSYQNPHGSGLGLSICKSLGYRLNIKLDFNSEYGKGSNFFVYVPLEMSDQVSKTLDNLTTNNDHLCEKISNFGFKKKNKNLKIYQNPNKNTISEEYCRTYTLKIPKIGIESEEIKENKNFKSQRNKSVKLHSSKELPRLKYTLSNSSITKDLVIFYLFVYWFYFYSKIINLAPSKWRV